MSLKQSLVHRITQLRNLLSLHISPLPPRKILTNTHYIESNPDDCGIACVAMILKSKNQKNITVGKLSAKYKKEGYYHHKIGWNHQGLANVLTENGITASAHRFKSLRSIYQQVLKRKPVIISVLIPERDNLGKNLYTKKNNTRTLVGHLCLVIGIEGDNFILHDPRNIGVYSQNLKIPAKTLTRIFTGNCIVID